LYFRPSINKCSCGNLLKVYKTKTRSIATINLGECNAHITQLYCEICNRIFNDEEIQTIVPEQCKFGFDIIVYVGKVLYQQHCNDLDVQQALREKNISISLSEISMLGKKFITYLALAHRESKDKIKHLMQAKGGYILRLDGTCEGDSAHLMSSIDEISNIVLDNIKIPTENAEFIIPMLERIKQNYGNPLAL